MIFGDGRLAGSAKALPTTYSCASGETSPPETAGGSRRRLTAKRGRLILPTYVNRICHDYTRGSGYPIVFTAHATTPEPDKSLPSFKMRFPTRRIVSGQFNALYYRP